MSGAAMGEQDGTADGGRRVTRAWRSEVGGSWWAALTVVTVVLGFLGRSSTGFWSPFLWSVVGFVLGSLAVIALTSARIGARSADEAFADVAPHRAPGRPAESTGQARA